MSFYGVLNNNKDSNVENVEIVNEVYVTSTENFAITVDGDGKTDRGFKYDPYFKVYNSTSVEKAKKVCRIRIRSATYVKPHASENRDSHWKLNSSERKELDNRLSDKNIWQRLITDTNKVINDRSKELDINLVKPDYTKLEDYQ